MSSWTLGALVSPLWSAKRAPDRLTMSPLPIIVLLCGLVAPMLLARTDLSTAVSSDHPSFDRRYFWAETETITPLLATAQIKRVAASRNTPYVAVRHLVDENSLDDKGIDVVALNLALDRHEQNK